MLKRSRTIAAIALLTTVAIACEKKGAGRAQDTGAAAAATTFDKSAETAAILAQDGRRERGSVIRKHRLRHGDLRGRWHLHERRHAGRKGKGRGQRGL